MIEFEFERFDGEIGLNRNKILGVAITIVISQAERDLLLKIKRKLKKFIYYLVFNIKREDINLFICQLDDIRVVRRKKTLLIADLEGTILNQNEYEAVKNSLVYGKEYYGKQYTELFSKGLTPKTLNV